MKKRSHGVLSRKKNRFRSAMAVNAPGKRFRMNMEIGIGEIRLHVSLQVLVSAV